MTARKLSARKLTAAFGLLAALPMFTGCGPDERVKPVDVEVKNPQTPLDQALTFLDRYAKGQPMGSEASQFDDIVTKVRATDPKKADALAAGFNEMKTAGPAQLKTKAAALIRAVSPNTAPQ